MKLKCVVNLFGGPGIGKSTISPGLFYRFKQLGVETEMVHEYAKELTYEGRKNVLADDQLYIFAKQHRKLLRIKDVVEYAIIDGPLLFSSIYFSEDSNIYDGELFNPLVLSTFNKYPNFNILLGRNSKYGYQEYGRRQTLPEAIEVDRFLETFLKNNNIPFTHLLSDEYTIGNIITMMKNMGLLDEGK